MPTSPVRVSHHYQSYKTLKKGQIRLLDVLPAANEEDPVRCRMSQVSLKEAGEYTAVSYAWGVSDDRHDIFIDDVEVSITRSLLGALKALRGKGHLAVWADAVCINQRDQQERSDQVRQMKKVYGKAKVVAVWLGPAGQDSDVAMRSLPDVEQVIAEDKRQVLVAMANLFQRDYWYRLWTVQEVAYAEEKRGQVEVYCGDIQCEWKHFKNASEVFAKHRMKLRSLFNERTAARTTLPFQNSLGYDQALVYGGPASYPAPGSQSLFSLLRLAREKLNEEPRDKVFAILGLRPEKSRVFEVDYGQSVRHIYTKAVRRVVQETTKLNIICESIHFPEHVGNFHLPSWVPDWSQNKGLQSLGSLYEFRASKKMTGTYKFGGESDNALCFDAIQIGNIKEHGISVGPLSSLADYLMAFMHWLALLRESAQHQEVNQFWETLCLGQVPRDYSPEEWSVKCEAAFASLLKERLPALSRHMDLKIPAEYDPTDDRQFIQDHFGGNMAGRCFCLLDTGALGMGTGAMLPDDIVVVPIGCDTPVVLREHERDAGKYRFIGDVYVNEYMQGKAIDELDKKERHCSAYELL
ncbi:heterokaryon incompatibility protein-domain-containing protein [Durotheca rogersii]|uniref:heterokaryon incompatibility protein-domain-containing protein n=1 Tax=Durotheca rogersii TaxID=419775 RepID=UPI00221F7BBF|nr:heterokaryon incompatibility protein-domain-containing protein [Durotheca rogersii]KAI5855073.1 heterokaryon incompatibility protein-domain-containing protein [Durotheca rogersii]